MPADGAFWVSAGQASAVVGGIVGCTTIGALLVRTSVDRMLDPDFEQANLDEFRKSQRGETKRRTRLRPEDLLEKPDQNIKPPQNGKQ
mmetsp:Transcript_20454/g.57045  ORF Transcript_20454/g.57045 Transcript_20454/m.57045 type:complete len:88 (+) Transcript_20454:123-386(+)|eukprot:CAMPEP_0202409276 /NCGR_PEP_ID=MMETSP1128-20130828/16640_1 /ASSEMBLY_ACC=CAM_ASM_000463 /TAXON_ID=3047 /ORGANISM="Dunaliella tertiolecta, Strain CCMP1320" /LENGTH=87 /DNA_ID=CAMNT_0049014573 /DNA_START=114 /DNA_END=377 /DNA_ORIENTATION=-